MKVVEKNMIQIGEYIMTLHHNIFAYLDYVFSATFILSDFIHIYFHIIYIYKIWYMYDIYIKYDIYI